MNIKVILGVLVVAVSLYFAVDSFNSNNIEYTNFEQAITMEKKVQVKGVWQSELETDYNPNKNTFTFFMKDDNEKSVKVILYGSKPNNFEIATSIVAKGRFRDNIFYANDILTKCPSKYEGDSKAVQRTL
ncbi:MAG: cytochrome c maturation protein CcmE [Bacteroidota bacterium]